MDIESSSGVAIVCRPSAEQVVVGYGMAWFQHGPRPRPDALSTLAPTQRPSAPLRWKT